MNKLNFQKKPYFLTHFLLIVLFTLFMSIGTGIAAPRDVKTIAILPFETNAREDIAYITAGVLDMLHSRLTWEDVIEPMKQKQVRDALKGLYTGDESSKAAEIGKKTHADFVITGVITQFSGAYSIDTKVYNLKENSFLTFFGQAKTIDTVISQVDIVAAKINKKVFDRTTASYENFKKEKIITEEDLKRMNPERMMPIPTTRDNSDKPWWKIW